jgi:hypothetical protein
VFDTNSLTSCTGSCVHERTASLHGGVLIEKRKNEEAIVKKIALSAALAAAAFIPQMTLAASPQRGALLAPDATQNRRFEIVDAATGAVVAILVPVSDAGNQLRIIGVVRAPAFSAPPAAAVPGLPDPLTPLQLNEQRQQQLDDQFHVDHTS